MTLLFTGGRLFDGKTMQDGQAVLVENGRIAKIAAAGTFSGFAGETVDCAGATLMPGLVDCHVHLCLGAEGDPGGAQDKLDDAGMALKALERAQKTLRGGVVAVRDCGGRNYVELRVRDAIKAGTFEGPVVSASGRVICMTGGHGNRTGRVADGKDDVIRAVREQIHAGVDQIKIMATGGVMTPGVDPEDAHYSAEEMAAGIAEANRFRRRTVSHAQGAEGILNAVRGGVTSIEHGIFMDDDCLKEMIERGTYLVPTLSAVANILRNKDRGIPEWAVRKCERVYQAHKASFRRFYEAGGRIAMGTDAGTPYNLHGENAQELRYMVEEGMSPIDALRAATAVAADLVGLEQQGRLAEGAHADLLLVDGDPSIDISRVADRANHRAVYKSGRPASGAPRMANGLGGFQSAAASSF
ncbi:metal-dependent hydrolase family protein [Oceanibacterium hippocampi]|uniref:Isoaspartyl dipeptidase n=1 Tax=Oceanibacterium hippocampi TaxID=745714 RepID=A0A1Y5RDM0_9PROT|nr:amidohydrolase family protein [Oceanibacterium hippocampi]SLN14932.1 isoaspartyl dipeptidase [Oceanibacterium hippocampi]